MPESYMDEDLEILFERFDLHDSIALFYDEETNRFITSVEGEIVNNPYKYVTPSQVFLFKQKKEDLVFVDVTRSFIVELVYLDYNYTKYT